MTDRSKKNRKRVLQSVLALLCTLILVLTVPLQAQALSANNRQFTLDGVPSSWRSPIVSYKNKPLNFHSVQNFAFSPDGKFIFTTQDADSEGSATHNFLSWFKVPEKKNKNAMAPYAGAVMFAEYGHSETLAVTQPNRKKQVYEIWLGCTPGSSGKPTEIARVTLAISGRGKGTIKKTVKITGFSKLLNISGAVVERMNVATDEASGRIAFRVCTAGHGFFYEIYDLKKLNAKLNAVKNKKSYNINNAGAFRIADVMCGLVPHQTFQSFDMDGNYIYVCGGNFGMGVGIYKIPYKKAPKRQYLSTMSSVSQNINLSINRIKIAGEYFGKDRLEVEGMKIEPNGKKVNYYINFVQKDLSFVSTIGIYKFTK